MPRNPASSDPASSAFETELARVAHPLPMSARGWGGRQRLGADGRGRIRYSLEDRDVPFGHASHDARRGASRQCP